MALGLGQGTNTRLHGQHTCGIAVYRAMECRGSGPGVERRTEASPVRGGRRTALAPGGRRERLRRVFVESRAHDHEQSCPLACVDHSALMSTRSDWSTLLYPPAGDARYDVRAGDRLDDLGDEKCRHMCATWVITTYRPDHGARCSRGHASRGRASAPFLQRPAAREVRHPAD